MSNELNSKDQNNIKLKCKIRSEYVEKYFLNQDLAVLETCAGEQGNIWSVLRKKHDVVKYLGFDKSPVSKGIVMGEAEELICSINVNDFNVIDMDAYGLPWHILMNITKRITGKTLLFLTVANESEKRFLTKFERDSLNIPLDWTPIPCTNELFKKIIPHCLEKSRRDCTLEDITIYWHTATTGELTGYLCMLMTGVEQEEDV